jgi:hypothetical protein
VAKSRSVIAYAALTLATSLGVDPSASAHEIPADVAVQMVARPRNDTLELLIRAPLEAMQDVEFPVVGPGYLDIPRADQALRNAAELWLASNVDVFVDAEAAPRPQLLAVRASLPSDRSFTSYETAIAHIRGPPLPSDTQIVWQQAVLDASFSVPIDSAGGGIAIEPRFARLGLKVMTTVKFVTSEGAVRALTFEGNPGRVTLDPTWHQAFLQFLQLGFVHIFEGTDHLLFLLCLILPMHARLSALIWTVTAFTLAHSSTLAAAAYGFAPSALWFPALIETLIAASILYMAIENVIVEAPRMRWIFAFAFGLVHGFGFSFALRNTLQLGGDHLLLSLAAFNIGVELAQIAAILALVAALRVLFKMTRQRRTVVLVISVLIAHTAWHWMFERYAILSEYDMRLAQLGDLSHGG